MKSISLKAYAKVNLSLDVTGKLDNGYHTLRSVMQAVNLFDEITVSHSENVVCENDTGYKIKLSVFSLIGDADEDTTSDAAKKGTQFESEVPSGKENLAYRAAEKMIEHFMPDTKGLINIVLNKKIPVAAGLAGGSTDASAVMLALAYLWGLRVELRELIGVAKTIGADVPFCLLANAKNNPTCGFEDDMLAASTALAEGIGEVLTPLPSIEGTLIFVKPPIPLSTPVVYSLYDERENLVIVRPDTKALISALNVYTCENTFKCDDGDENSRNCTINATPRSNEIKNNMINVLEPIVRSEYPIVAETLDMLREMSTGGRVFMSGSGPTVVVYFESDSEASSSMPIIERLFFGKAGIYKIKLL